MGQVPGRITEQEILAQPRLWNDTVEEVAASASAVRRLWQEHSPDQILLTGCGSSYYLAMTAAAILRAMLGIPCRALPSSEILFAPDETLLGPRPTFAVAISRSGETTETVTALEYLRARGAPTLALTCSRGGMLSHAGDFAVDLPVEEHSIVMTGSFTSMLLALAALGADLAGDGALTAVLGTIPAMAQSVVPRLFVDAQERAGDEPRSYVYLGGGPLFGIASEGALKMTEMALLPARAYHALEFLHGPKAAVTRDTLIVGLLSERGRPYEGQVLRHVSELGAEVLAVGSREAGLTSVDVGAPAGSVPGMLLAAVWTQSLALHVARARGVDPDAPQFLQPVVMWEGSRILTEGR